MNDPLFSKHRILTIIVGSAVVLGMGAAGYFLFRGFNDSDGEGHTYDENTIWTCSMHPNVRLPEPGKCPLCPMDLIPLDPNKPTLGPRQISMSEEARILAEIETTEIKRGLPSKEVRLFGKIALNESAVRTLSARFSGRIDRLFIDYTGIRVTKGDHLAEIYSPDLLLAQTELLTSLKYNSKSPATLAARDKLRLWGLSESAIKKLEQSKKPTDHMEIDATMGGIVLHKNVNQGDYIKEGTPLFKIADLSQVWVQLDAYESDMPWLRYGQPVEFTVEGVPGETFPGRISFIMPELDPATRTVKVRVIADNPGELLKPGMFVNAVVKSQVAGSGRVISPALAGKWISPMHPEIIKDNPGNCDICGMKLVKAESLGYALASHTGEHSLLIPVSAVLKTGKRAIAFVQVNPSGDPVYEGREIILGPRAGDHYLVKTGVEEGERVVTYGAFKIDSSLQLDGKPSMMSMSDSRSVTWAARTVAHEEVAALLDGYMAIQKALADDKVEDARKSAEALLKLAPVAENAPVGDPMRAIVEAAEIGSARKAFESVSLGFFELAEEHADSLERPLYKAFCPMAFKNKGAAWLQGSKEIRNPYFGDEMLECGEITMEFRKTDTPAGKRPAGGHEGHNH